VPGAGRVLGMWAGILAVFEMHQDALDQRWIFVSGDHFHLTATDLSSTLSVCMKLSTWALSYGLASALIEPRSPTAVSGGKK